MRPTNLLLTLLTALCVLGSGLAVSLLPVSAHADLTMAGGKRDRAHPRRGKRIGRLETLPRRGINVGASVKPGAVGIAGTFVPAVRGTYEIGGGITDRFTLGLALGGTGYLGLEKGSFNADVVAHRYFGKGLFVRGALGVASHVPAMVPVPMAPAVGGSMGLGYEFRVLERVGLGLGVDYDLRLRTDGRLSQAWFLGLRFTGFLDKKK